MKGLLVGGALAFGGALIGYTIGAGVDLSRKAAWWDLMTAIGTVGAAISAVGIALWEQSRGEKWRNTEHSRASYEALLSNMRMEKRACDDASRACLVLIAALADGENCEAANATALRVRGILDRCLEMPTNDHIASQIWDAHRTLDSLEADLVSKGQRNLILVTTLISVPGRNRYVRKFKGNFEQFCLRRESLRGEIEGLFASR